MHGGVKKEDLKTENMKALEAGMTNLQRHVENVQKFAGCRGVDQPLQRRQRRRDRLVKSACATLGVEAVMADNWAEGGKGAADVAHAVVKAVDSGKSNMKLLYPDDMPLVERSHHITKEATRPRHRHRQAVRTSSHRSRHGLRQGAVCIAKTQ